MKHIPKLSFCMTCKNRLHQIKKTLPKNLSDNKFFKEIIEFVLVDFGSQDGLKEWVLSSFVDELKEGYLAYYYTDELPSWHASVAKNTSHFFAAHDLLVNLDCDNYTGRFGGKFVIKNFIRYGTDMVSHQFSSDYGDGTYGRIGLSKAHFIRLGGYDESFEPMGFQDVDLISRAQSIGLKYKNIYNIQYTGSIINSKSEKIRYCNSELSYDQMNLLNWEKSYKNRQVGKYIANDGLFGIRKNVFNYLGKEMKV
jgi:hypothetical protein